jgi:hypothetical protein
MRRADFFYQLPAELIADRPLPRRGRKPPARSTARTGALADLCFSDLGSCCGLATFSYSMTRACCRRG